MPGSLLGNAVRRVEDPDLLLGRGTYVDNMDLRGALRLAFVRSPIPHGRILGVTRDRALSMPGVVDVLTAGDLGVPPQHSFMVLNPACGRPPLADGKVRFVGDPVAVVVAETAAQAVDAAEAVEVDLEPLPAAVDPEEALAPGAPLQFEELGTNLAAGRRTPGGDQALEGAEVVVRARMVNQRVAVVPMEGNAIAAVPGPDGDGHTMTVYVSTQMPHFFARRAAELLGMEPAQLRVVAPHVGGAFGSKAGIGAEHAVAMVCAARLGRPVRWAETRSENMVAMPHGRGQIQYVELGLTREGRITGLRCRMVGDAGAYAGFGGALAMGPTRSMAQGVYATPAVAYDVAVALTNTTPMGAFRGAGRPEAAAMLERIMDIAAAQLGMDPAELRRRNFIPPEAFPYQTLMGPFYDTGEYARALDEALRLCGYEELRAEQARRRDRGDRHQLGIGMSAYVEVTAGAGSSEYASVEVHRDGTATVSVGTSAHGQGHATSFSMIVADRLGLPLEAVRFVQSDTARVPRGGGTGGSRSLQLGGSAVHRAAGEVLRQARELAAQRLEASAEDIVVTGDGRLGVAGVPASALSWGELVELAEAAGDHGGDGPGRDGSGAADALGPLAAALDFDQGAATFPFGAHVAVVEVDTDTGEVVPLRHVAVDDCGRVLNPLIVAGQQHGGIAQGMAQALWEQMVYDEDGNPLTTTLADYPMPSAAELCSFEAASTETPTTLNPLGAKGVGESPTVGSTPAVLNAVVDALSHLGVHHLDMPCTPERVWSAIRDARAGTLPPLWREPPAFFDSLPVPAAEADPEAASVDI